MAAIPSPPTGGIEIGPLSLRAYGLMIALGVAAAVWWSNRRWQARGGSPETISAIAVWAVPAGVVGARLYHVITDNQRFRGRWLDAFKIWEGGLGIWGGIAAGVLIGVFVARRRGEDVPALLDVVAPAIPLAQAIGRIGNWFNQELFGRPTTLPWGLQIDAANRPEGFEQFSTFHPTFLYEALWNLVVVALVLVAERRLRLRPGRLFAVYVAGYTFMRFWIEGLRIDPANRIGGFRVNEWVSLVLFVIALVVVLTGFRRRGSRGEADVTDGTAQELGEEAARADH